MKKIEYVPRTICVASNQNIFTREGSRVKKKKKTHLPCALWKPNFLRISSIFFFLYTIIYNIILRVVSSNNNWIKTKIQVNAHLPSYSVYTEKKKHYFVQKKSSFFFFTIKIWMSRLYKRIAVCLFGENVFFSLYPKSVISLHFCVRRDDRCIIEGMLCTADDYYFSLVHYSDTTLRAERMNFDFE